MTITASVGQVLINAGLPEDLRDYNRVIDKKSVKAILQEVADKHPEKYSEVLKHLMDTGRSVSSNKGLSVSLKHLLPHKSKAMIIDRLRAQNQADIDNDDLSDDDRNKRIVARTAAAYDELQKAVMEESKTNNSPYALQVVSGARGNAAQLNSLVGADLVVSDTKNQPVPIPVLNNYSDGLDPWEYWASAYGQRKGAIDVKMSTADAGYLCLRGNTEVRMADFTTKEIKDIRVGDMVMGADKSGKAFPVRVSAVFENGVRDVYRFTFRPGRNRSGFVSVDATLDHKVLARRKLGSRKRSGSGNAEYRLGDMVRKRGYGCVPADAYSSQGEAHPFAFVYGYLLGDGGLTGHDTTFSTGDAAIVAYMRSILEPIGMRVDKVNRKALSYEYSIREKARPTYKRDSLGRVVAGECDKLRVFLSRMGILGKYAHEKYIAPEVLQWPVADVAAVVAGLIASDGCTKATNHGTMPTVGFAVTSERLSNDLKRLLEIRLGVYASPVSRGETNKEMQTRVDAQGTQRTFKANYDVHCVTVSNREAVTLLSQRVFIPGAKGEKLRDMVAAAAPEMKDERYSFAFMSREYLGSMPTFDIEVATPDHLFVLANGLIVSNSKQLALAAHRQVVTAREPNKSRLPVGLVVDPDDDDNVGAVLAAAAGPFKAGTVITPKVHAALREAGKRYLVHSPLTSITDDGGIDALSAGRRERGDIAAIGDNVGTLSAQAIGEPLSQGMLNSKHSSGVQGAKANRGGFEYLNKLLQAPENFEESSPLATKAGRVASVEEAPQGGTYVSTTDGERYFLRPGIAAVVKPGQELEPGDDIGDGVPHPRQLVETLGIGEARRRFTGLFVEALRNSGIDVNRRNVETVVAGMLDYAKITDPDGSGDHVVDDIVPYRSLANAYKPRPDAQLMPPKRAIGRYLEEPVLHYTPGTLVTKRVAKDLEEFGIADVHSHESQPGFAPHFERLLTATNYDPDWQTQLGGFYISRAFPKAVQRGAVSDTRSTSFIPGLAQSTDFGKTLKTEGRY